MNELKGLKKAFGVNELGFVDIPKKISNIKIARILFGDERGCSHCFPHGYETTNATVSKNRRSWKNNRKFQRRQ